METTIFRARHVASMDGPVIDDGCVVVAGDRIVEIGRTSRVNPTRIDEDIDGVLMPGLINAHTHLELTDIPRPPAPIEFTDWIIAISQSIRGDKTTFASRRAEAVKQGIAQCLKYGVTCVGDISQNVEIVRPLLRQGPIRSVSYGECLGIGARRERFDFLLEKATTEPGSDLCVPGISPHAPYTVDESGYRAVQAEQARGFPVSTHLAETPGEAAFLVDHSGPFGELYQRLSVDPGQPPGWFSGPIRGLCDRVHPANWLFAHVNHCDDEEIKKLSENRVGVVWCPRTHRYFGHPRHRWREMMARGIVICVGTDSCASSPDLNLVDDLRLIYAENADIRPEAIWSLATTQSARALQWKPDQPLGVLASGAMADLVSFATKTGDPLREILITPSLTPVRVWIGGKGVWNVECRMPNVE